MNYKISKHGNGCNFARIPHSDHISRKKINKDKIKSSEFDDKYGKIPRKIAKICGVKNLDRAEQVSVDSVMNIANLVETIKLSTNYSINEILATLSNIRRRDTLRKNRTDKLRIIEKKLTINYLGEDYWLTKTA